MEQPVLYSGWLEKQGGVFTGKAPFPTPSFNAVLFPNPKTETPSLSLQPPPLPFAVRRGVMAGAVAVAGDSASAGALSGQSNFITPLCWIAAQCTSHKGVSALAVPPSRNVSVYTFHHPTRSVWLRTRPSSSSLCSLYSIRSGIGSSL